MAITSYRTEDQVQANRGYESVGGSRMKRYRGGDRRAMLLAGRNKYGKKTVGSQIAAGAIWTGIGIAAGVAGYFTGGVAGAAIIAGATAASAGARYKAEKQSELASRGTEQHKDIARTNEGVAAAKTGVQVGGTAVAAYGGLASAGVGAAGTTTTTAAGATGTTATTATTTTTATGTTGTLTGSITPTATAVSPTATSATGFTAGSTMGSAGTLSGQAGTATGSALVQSGAAGANTAAGATTMKVSSAGNMTNASSQAPIVEPVNAQSAKSWERQSKRVERKGKDFDPNDPKLQKKQERINRRTEQHKKLKPEQYEPRDAVSSTPQPGQEMSNMDKINKALEVIQDPGSAITKKLGLSEQASKLVAPQINKLGASALAKGMTLIKGGGKQELDPTEQAAARTNINEKQAQVSAEASAPLQTVAEKPVMNDAYFADLGRRQSSYVDFSNMSQEEFAQWQAQQQQQYA